MKFPISRDPPEGGTSTSLHRGKRTPSFQFLGIPPKGEPDHQAGAPRRASGCFQFLGIPPKGEPNLVVKVVCEDLIVSNF